MEMDNTLVVKNTYNAIAEYFAPFLSVENSSKDEVDFMNSFFEIDFSRK